MAMTGSKSGLMLVMLVCVWRSSVASRSDCGSISPRLKGCSCSTQGAGGSYRVECLHLNTSDPTIFQHIPENTDQAVFRGNRFYHLVPRMFGERGEKLRVLDLDNNRIQIIDGQSLNHLVNLETLVLSDNDLYLTLAQGSEHPRMFTSLHKLRSLNLRDTFAELVGADDSMSKLEEILRQAGLTRSLSYLNLEQNEIRVVKPSLMSYLSNLVNLTLAHNNISHLLLEPADMQSIVRLDLTNNSLVEITPRTIQQLKKMRSLRHLILARNPLACDCRVQPLWAWLRQTRAMTEAEKLDVRCASGERVLDQDKVRPCVLKERVGHAVEGGGMSSAYVALTIIVVGMTVLMVVIAYLNRRVLITCCYTSMLRPLGSNYIHIQNESEGGEYHV